MIVVPVAHTVIDPLALDQSGYDLQGNPPTDIDELAEAAGRNCYLSWHRPNPGTRENWDYLANIIRQGHYSVMEHGSVSFYVSGLSRSGLAELTRHRHLSFSVVSQRYVEADRLGPVIPALFDELEPALRAKLAKKVIDHWLRSLALYREICDELQALGYKRKQRQEAAREVLPNCVESPLFVTGNLRAWRDVLAKRHHVAADKQLQRFARLVLKHLRDIAPACVQDIPDEPYGSEEERG